MARKAAELTITVCAKRPLSIETKKALSVLAEKAKAALENMGPVAKKAMCVPPHLAKFAMDSKKN